MAGPALAQTAVYPPTGPKLPRWSDLADWDSVWERGGDVVWDDRIPVGQPQVPPYNAEYAPLYAQALEKRRAQSRYTPGGPPPLPPLAGIHGMPGFMTMMRPMDVQVTPFETLITSETGEVRHIYTDGRLHPEYTPPNPWGHSIGRWENKTLVVDTCCISPDFPLFGGGPHSDAMHITERLYSPKPNMLVDEVSVEDPKAFTHPWTTVKTFYRRPGWELLAPGGGG
jgi:hypothetical protein